MSNKTFKIIVIGVLFLLLMMIRILEKNIFYDPFITFFKSDFIKEDLPDFELAKLLWSTTLRYIINAVLSIFVLYIAFQKKNVLKFSGVFYGIAYVVLILMYTYLLGDLSKESHVFFFYVRRFLIQPIFLLLLMPAFYYQKLLRKN